MNFQRKFDPSYLSIVVLAIFLYVGYDRLIENISTETARETINSAIGVIFVIITTMYMLNKQTEVERKKELNNEIFKKKLEYYERALSLWQNIGFIDKKIDQIDRANCLEVQFNLMAIAPTEVAECATGINKAIITVYLSESKQTLDEDDKERLLRKLADFAKLVRKDLDLPNTSLELDSKLALNMEEVVVQAGTKNYDKYSFANENYNKRRLVLAVVKQTVKNRNPQNFEDLELLFPKEWHSKGKQSKSKQAVVYLKKRAEQERLRFFDHPDDIIKLSDGNIAVVNNQWGENTDYFISKATETLGIEIERQT
ncbi:MAG: hypothetical protein L7U61_05605 [Flavobacteriaceae bacterium]|nr:hypothetical protein [Flavobacteriaceae bacterium]